MSSHAGELYSSTESNKILVRATACMNLKGLRVKRQTYENRHCIVTFYEMSEETDPYRQKVKLGEGEM